MDRRRFLKTMGMEMAALTAMQRAAAAQGEARRRNVLLYVVDDLGTDDAGCYGNPAIRTPGLDALAREGVRFTQAFCTTASCSPSRSVMLTGRHNHANGMYGLSHAKHHFASFDNERTLPVLLAEAGYRTLNAGKYHVAPERTYHFQDYLRVGAPADMAEQCRAFIESDDPRPFFLCFNTTEPHRPFRNEGADPVRPEDVIVPPYLPDIPECREELAEYYRSAQRADAGLLGLIDILRETGRWDDTLVVFVSDNGIAFPGAKTTAYEPGLRLPCVVRDPFQPGGGRVNNALVTWADLMPTILEFAGVAHAPDAFHGRSFLPVLGEENPAGWDEACMSHTFHEVTMYYPMRTVRTRRHKLIWNIASGLEYPFASDLWESKTWQAVRTRGIAQYGKRRVEDFLRRPEFELYDLEQDPDEVVNLADDPAFADVCAALKERLRAFQERTDDPWLLKWDRE